MLFRSPPEGPAGLRVARMVILLTWRSANCGSRRPRHGGQAARCKPGEGRCCCHRSAVDLDMRRATVTHPGRMRPCMWILGGSSSGSPRASRSTSPEPSACPAEWTSTGERITIAHPRYPAQRHVMSICEVADSDPSARFAAGEFSNGILGSLRPCAMTRRGLGHGTHRGDPGGSGWGDPGSFG